LSLEAIRNRQRSWFALSRMAAQRDHWDALQLLNLRLSKAKRRKLFGGKP